MNCKSCGKIIPDGQTVCHFCGTDNTPADAYRGYPQNNSYGYQQNNSYGYLQNSSYGSPQNGSYGYAQSYNPGYVQNNGYGYGGAVAQRAGVRQGELEELERMIYHFSQKQAQYDEYDRVVEKLNPNNRRKRVGLLVWGIILSAISALVFIITLALSNRYGLGYYVPTGVSVLTVLSALVFFGGITMIIMFAVTSASRNSNYSDALVRYDELAAELTEHYRAYQTYRGFCLVSIEYTNPYNLDQIRRTIQSGRADTIADAINILVEDAHRSIMQEIAMQNAAAARAAANGARTAAIFSAAAFFLRR